MKKLDKQLLIAFMGLPGAGKTTITKALEPCLDKARIISRDTIRKAMFDPCDYTNHEKNASFVALKHATKISFSQGYSILIDGMCFSSHGPLEELEQLAHDNQISFVLFYCDCPIDLAINRVEEDFSSGKHVAKDRDKHLVQNVANRFRPIPDNAHIINTALTTEENISTILNVLRKLK